ncbi:MAG: homocysteine S-methyltransferase family protein [Terriglobales bacterium]
MHQPLEARLNSREPVLLDGAMGTELVRRGVRWRKHGLLTDADRVQLLHEEYLAAGAEVIRTNTFQLNPRIYLNVFRNRQHMRHIGAPGLEDLTPKLLRTSVRVARQARANAGKEQQAAIAGVLAPLEHCFRPDLAPAFEQARGEQLELARVFAEEKVDLLLGESLNTIAEARAVAEVARAVGLPVWISFVIGPEGELLSREPLAQAIREVEKLGAQAVLVNCAPPAEIGRALAKVKAATRLPYGGFAHIGRFSPPSWKFEFFPQFSETETWPPERYAGEAQRWRDEGATILGGCCGTTPAHIAALHAALGARREGAKSA